MLPMPGNTVHTLHGHQYSGTRIIGDRSGDGPFIQLSEFPV